MLPPKTSAILLPLTVCALGFFVQPAARAALPANDNADNYTGDITTGSNAGTGFQPFVVSGQTFNGISNNGVFTAAGLSGSDINGPNGRVFGIFAATANLILVDRPFTANGGTGVGSLDVGQIFSVSMDHRTSLSVGGGSAGIALATNGSTERFALQFDRTNGLNQITFSDGNGGNQLLAGVPGSILDTGVRLQFTLSGVDAYNFVITDLSNTVLANFSGALGGTAGAGVEVGRLFGFQSGNDGNDLLFNNPTVAVPEPSTYAMIVGGFGLLLGARRFRRTVRA